MGRDEISFSGAMKAAISVSIFQEPDLAQRLRFAWSRRGGIQQRLNSGSSDFWRCNCQIVVTLQDLFLISVVLYVYISIYGILMFLRNSYRVTFVLYCIACFQLCLLLSFLFTQLVHDERLCFIVPIQPSGAKC